MISRESHNTILQKAGLAWTLTLLLFLMFPGNSEAQEIDFGQYSTRYSITVIPVVSSLDFGTVMQNEGTREIAIEDGAIIEFEGIKYLDVLLDISVSDPFQTAGCSSSSCTLPLTLKVAYSNYGEATEMAALNKTVYIGDEIIDFGSPTALLSTQFQILRRSTTPPGPPPTPVYEGYDLEAQKEKAYLFVYGSIFADGIDIGNYSTNVTVSINYD